MYANDLLINSAKLVFKVILSIYVSTTLPTFGIGFCFILIVAYCSYILKFLKMNEFEHICLLAIWISFFKSACLNLLLNFLLDFCLFLTDFQRFFKYILRSHLQVYELQISHSVSYLFTLLLEGVDLNVV